MFAWLTNFKDRLTHVSPQNWHYRAVKGAGFSPTGKACTYYWMKLPAALLWLGIAYGMMGMLLGVISICAWIAGYYTTIFPSGKKTREQDWWEDRYEDHNFVYPHNVTPWGWKQPLAPWEVILLGLIGYRAYLVWIDPTTMLPIFGYIIGSILAIVVIGWSIIMLWKTPTTMYIRDEVGKLWDRACPTLVIEQTEFTQEKS